MMDNNGPGRPSLTRRGSSILSIDDESFEWLKRYVEDSTNEAGSPAVLLPSPPRRGQKHSLEDDELSLVTMTPMKADDEDDDDDGDMPLSSGASGAKRRKVGWTNTEDLTILAAVRRIGTQWQRIASNLPGRTADAVRNRWHRLQKTHALNDSDEGRSALDSLLVASGIDPEWCPPELAESANEPRVRGADHGRHMWTAQEDRIIEDGVRRFGCKWRQIAALLPNRTDSSVRNRWMRLCKERGSERVSERASLREESEEGVGASPGSITRQSSQTATPRRSTESLMEELCETVSNVEVERLPLGLDTPMSIVDLDSFVEAVSACVYEEEGDGPCTGMPHFSIDETPRLAARPPAKSADGAARAARQSAAVPIQAKLASAAMGTIALASMATSAISRRRA